MNKSTFLLMDGHNLFHRMIHQVNPAAGIDGMIGLSFHLMLYSLKKEWNRFNGTHAVFFTEGYSWRYDIYKDYKKSRKVIFAQKTEKEKEDRDLLTEAFDDLVEFLDQKTNMTVLQNPRAEADDMIATWIRLHPDDDHILISSDSDFYQLLAPNVKIYDPVKDILLTDVGITDDRDKNLSFVVKDGKISSPKVDPNFKPEKDWFRYALFMKIIRGDTSDYIFSAYPGIREKGTKDKIGIREAYNNQDVKGFDWNNFMNQSWVDIDQKTHIVKDLYERNRILIDLTAQPDSVKESCENIIVNQVSRKNISAPNIGMAFLQFCTRWNLPKISNNAQQFTPLFNSKYYQDLE